MRGNTTFHILCFRKISTSEQGFLPEKLDIFRHSVILIEALNQEGKSHVVCCCFFDPDDDFCCMGVVAYWLQPKPREVLCASCSGVDFWSGGRGVYSPR